MKRHFIGMTLAVAAAATGGTARAADTRLETWNRLQTLEAERDALVLRVDAALNANRVAAAENDNLRLAAQQKERLAERVAAGEVAAQAEPIVAAPETSRVVWQRAFDQADPAFRQPHLSFPTLADGKTALCVESPTADEGKYFYATIVLPVEQIENRRIRCSALVKAEDVTAPPKHYMGVKFLLNVNLGDKSDWPGPPLGGGTFDWTPKSFTADIPAGAKQVTMLLGMQGVGGKVYFRDVKVERLD